MWANRDWIGRFFPSPVKPVHLLDRYQQCFDAVEANTTFYGLPAARTVARWAEETTDRFRFLFKVPQLVTHARALRDSGPELEQFCRRIEPLGSRIGPVSIQLPASFGPDQLLQLRRFVAGLTAAWEWPWSVEVRHPDFFTGGPDERELNDLLHGAGMDRVVLDSRALFSTAARTGAERAAQHAKPRLAVRPVATGSAPVVRFIGNVDAAVSASFWSVWFPVVVRWVEQGRCPTLTFHTADNLDAPWQAQRFWAELAAYAPDHVRAPRPPQPGEATLDLH